MRVGCCSQSVLRSFLPHITEQPCFCLGLGRYTPLLGETKLRSLSSCCCELSPSRSPATSEATVFPEIIVAFSGKRLEAAAAASEVTTPTASLPNSLPKSDGSFEELSSSPLLLTLQVLRGEGELFAQVNHTGYLFIVSWKIFAKWIFRICP